MSYEEWYKWQVKVIREELAELKQEKGNKSPKYIIGQEHGNRKENT